MSMTRVTMYYHLGADTILAINREWWDKCGSKYIGIWAKEELLQEGMGADLKPNVTEAELRQCRGFSLGVAVNFPCHLLTGGLSQGSKAPNLVYAWSTTHRVSSSVQARTGR